MDTTPSSAVREFAWHHENVDGRTVAPHRHLDAPGNRVLDHQLLYSGRGDDVVAVDADHDVAAAQARLGGGTVLHDARDLQPGRGAQPHGERRSDGDARARDAQPGATHPAR